MRPCRRCGGIDRYPLRPSDRVRERLTGGCVHCYRADCARKKLERRYLLDRQQAEVALVNAQGGLCDACGQLRYLNVDHAHPGPREPKNWNTYPTGPARGMLCAGCNQVAGRLERGVPTSHPNRSAVERYLADRAPCIPPPGAALATP